MGARTWLLARSLLGLFFSLGELLSQRVAELAALDGDEDVSILCGRRHELSDDVFGVAASAHAQRLEALKTVRIVDVELFQGEASVLHQIRKQGRILHRLDDVRIVWEVLYGDTYTRSIKQTI